MYAVNVYVRVSVPVLYVIVTVIDRRSVSTSAISICRVKADSVSVTSSAVPSR